MKLKIILILFLLFLFLPKQKIYAVVKTSGSLEVTTDEPLFGVTTVWYPGLSVSKSLVVKNKGTEKRFVSIQSTNMSPFMMFFSKDELQPGQEKIFDINISLPKNIGNEFQNKITKFDLIIGFDGVDSQVTMPEILGVEENINTGISTKREIYWWLLPLIFSGGLLLRWFLGKMRSDENH